MPALRFLRENAPWLTAGLLLAFGSNFGQTFFISLFGAQYRAELGLSHGEFGAIYMGATLFSALTLVQTGWLADRVPARALGVMVLVGLAAVCALMAQVQTIWVFALAIFGLRYAGQGMLSHVAITATARWFAARRGRALAVASWGHPLGEGLLPPIIAILLTMMPWRDVWMVCAAMIILGLVPLYALILRRERTPEGAEAGGAPVTGLGGRHWTRREVLRHPLFWYLLPALMASPLIGTAALFHQAHIVEIKGWTLVQFTAGFTVYAALSVAVSLIFGVLVDRFGALRVLPLYLLPLTAGMFVLGVGTSPFVPLFSLGMIGATAGAGIATLGAMWAELYGTRHLGSIRALSMAAMVFSTALGPGLTGTLIDLGVGFEAQCVAMAAIALAMAGWMYLLLRSQLSGKSSPISE